jgi:hypothetical protein
MEIEMTITTTARELAREIVRTHDLSLCPILADALDDADSADQEAVRELRAEAVFGRRPITAEVGKILIGLLGVRVERVAGHDGRSGRLRTRTVDADRYASKAAAEAVVIGRSWVATHGGSVANSYGYAAETEGVLAAAVYDTTANVVRVRVWAGQLPANKVTTGGVCGLFGFRDLADDRVGAFRREAARQAVYAAVTQGATR